MPSGAARRAQDLGSAAPQEPRRRSPGPRSNWVCSPARPVGVRPLSHGARAPARFHLPI
jgi:hypothetical protein